MKKENIVTIIVLVVLIVALGYSISLVNKPGGNFIKNLTEPPEENKMNLQPKIDTTPKPGDEKLVKKDIVMGVGQEVKAGDTISVNYVGILENGTKFDSSYDRHQPFEFIVGAGQVIRGWDIGLIGMKAGGKRELIIPSELAYGKTGQGTIPPNSTLKFTIELLEIKNTGNEVINLKP